MENATAPINLKGAMGLIKKSKYPLAPVYEATTNSLEAIAQKQYGRDEERVIEVKFYFSGLVDEIKNLQRIDIYDNGIGFNDENYERFRTLLDNSKGYNNRGSGRIQYLHRVDRVEVESFFEKEGRIYKRDFSCDNQDYITNHNCEISGESTHTGTTISLIGFNFSEEEQAFFDELKIQDIKNDIKKKFLLRFHLGKEKEDLTVPTIKISFLKNEDEVGTETISAEDIPSPQEHGDIDISYVKVKDQKADEIEWVAVPEKKETLHWAHFKLPEAELEENGVYLCSKDVPVEDLPFKEVKKKESVDGNRYITCVYGGILDNEEYVSHSVDSFTFPDQKETEKALKQDLFFDPEKEFLFSDDIKREVNKVISRVYGDVFKLREEKDEQINAIAKAHGIPTEIAQTANIQLTDDEQKITDKIYRKQAEHQSRENQKIKKLYESLDELNPTAENYQAELTKRTSELLELIPQRNQEELSRYVIRREMVTHILRLILDNALSDQNQKGANKSRKDNEGLIHDLIFKRKSKDTGELNDLWILNEEYIHFDGCSELPLNQIEYSEGKKLLPEPDETLEKHGVNRTLRRPDIFLYPDEGKCVLIELKAPDVDLTDHLNQLFKYCKMIANFATPKIDKFYCYLIGENISQIDIPDEYNKTVYDDWVKVYSPINSVEMGKEDIRIGSIYTEVIKLSSIYTRAHRRNKSFADKLGIRIDEVNPESEAKAA